MTPAVNPHLKRQKETKIIVKMRDIIFVCPPEEPVSYLGQADGTYRNNQNRKECDTGFAKSFFFSLSPCFLFISFIYCRVWCSARVVRDNVNLGQQQQETMQFHTTQQIGTIAQI